MTDTQKIAGILEFLADAEDALTDPCVMANATLRDSVTASIADAKRQIRSLVNTPTQIEKTNA